MTHHIMQVIQNDLDGFMKSIIVDQELMSSLTHVMDYVGE